MKQLLITACVVLIAGAASAATHCIAPSGSVSNDGNGWASAWPNIPVPAVNGDTYIVAGGNYRRALDIKTSQGSATTTIRHATATDTACGAFPNAAYYTEQAVWTGGSAIRSSHVVVDGMTRPADWWKGNLVGYGFKIDNSARAGNNAIDLQDTTAGTGVSDITLAHMDMVGTGNVKHQDRGAYSVLGMKSLTIRNSAIHDVGNTIILARGGWSNVTLDGNYFARNHSTPDLHGEGMSSEQVNDWIIKNNVWVDMEGTATVLALINGANDDGYTSVSYNVNVYNNLAYWTAAYQAACSKGLNGCGTTGFIDVAWDDSQHNCLHHAQMMHNTIVDQNFQGANHAGIYAPWDQQYHVECGIENANTNKIYNNLWWNSTRGANASDNGFGPDGKPGKDYNLFYNTYDDQPSQSRHDKRCYVQGWWGLQEYGLPTLCDIGKSTNPFKDPANGDFHLTYEIYIGADLTPYFRDWGMDLDGVARTPGHHDVGAYQYVPGS